MQAQSIANSSALGPWLELLVWSCTDVATDHGEGSRYLGSWFMRLQTLGFVEGTMTSKRRTRDFLFGKDMFLQEKSNE